MNTPYSNEHVKQLLKDTGQTLQRNNPTHQEHLRAVLQNRIAQTPPPQRRPRFSRKPLFLPSFAFAVLALLLVVSSFPTPNNTSESPLAVLDSATTSEQLLDASALYGESATVAPTFRDRFLKSIGKHTATQNEINAYRTAHGDAFEENTRINLLSKKEDATSRVQRLIEQAGGIVESVKERSGGMTTITGRVPANRMESLRDDLQTFVVSERFYSETTERLNRVTDMVVINKKIQEVEEAIATLEARLASETHPATMAQIERDLAKHRAYLAERQGTQQLLVEEVGYVDVSIVVKEIVSWWQATSYSQIAEAVMGYEKPGFGGRLLMNTLFSTIILTTILSYTFWIIIPVVIWRIVRRYNTIRFKDLD